MTKLEEIARAICTNEFTESGLERYEDDWKQSTARAAIEAMREPTEAMLKAPYGAGRGARYRAMMDTALNEHKDA